MANKFSEVRFRKPLRRTSLFVLITAETSKEIVMGAREYQPDGYIAKPVTRSVLEKRLGAMLLQREALLPINRGNRQRELSQGHFSL